MDFTHDTFYNMILREGVIEDEPPLPKTNMLFFNWMSRMVFRIKENTSLYQPKESTINCDCIYRKSFGVIGTAEFYRNR